MCAVSKSRLYELIQAGEFPRPKRLGPQSVAWLDEDVEEWIRTRPEAGSDAAA